MLAENLEVQRTRGWLLFLVLALITLGVVAPLVTQTLGPAPYMDEIFHIRQTQHYCYHANYSHWDDKITTLPGLYAVVTIFGRGASFLLQPVHDLVLFFAPPLSDDMSIPLPFATNNFSIPSDTTTEEISTDSSSHVQDTPISKDQIYVYPALFSEEMLALVQNIVIQSIQSVSNGKSPILIYLCSATFLRLFVNTFFGLATVYILHRLICQAQEPSDSAAKHALRLFILWTFPLSFFFYFLFYTDAGSLFFVILTLYLVEINWTRTSVIPALVAVLFRQTNIVWIGYILAAHLIKLAYEYKKQQPAKHNPNMPVTKTRNLTVFEIVASVVVEALPNLVAYSFRNFFTLLLKFGLHICLVAAFAVFVVWNGGITVGDRSAHQAVLHLPYILYFVAFSFIFGVGMMFYDSTTGSFNLKNFVWSFLTVHLWRFITRPLAQGIATGVIITAMYGAIEYFTMAHAYLLADNRHFTFYLWQRSFQRFSWFKTAMIPVYYFCGWKLLSLMLWAIAINLERGNHSVARKLRTQAHAALQLFIFFIFTAITLVPSPLLEFRYFIVPFTLLSLMILPRVQSYTCLSLQLAFNIALSAATLYLFLFRPFEWPNAAEPVARFIW